MLRIDSITGVQQEEPEIPSLPFPPFPPFPSLPPFPPFPSLPPLPPVTEPILQPTPELIPNDLIFSSELRVLGENEFYLTAPISSDFIVEWYIETSQDIFPPNGSNLQQLDFFNGEWTNSSGDAFFVETNFISGQNY